MPRLAPAALALTAAALCAAAEAAAPKLVGHWAFGGDGLKDEAGGPAASLDSGGAVVGLGGGTNALRLWGNTTSTFEIPHHPAIDDVKEWTVSLWFNWWYGGSNLIVKDDVDDNDKGFTLMVYRQFLKANAVNTKGTVEWMCASPLGAGLFHTRPLCPLTCFALQALSARLRLHRARRLDALRPFVHEGRPHAPHDERQAVRLRQRLLAGDGRAVRQERPGLLHPRGPFRAGLEEHNNRRLGRAGLGRPSVRRPGRRRHAGEAPQLHRAHLQVDGVPGAERGGDCAAEPHLARAGARPGTDDHVQRVAQPQRLGVVAGRAELVEPGGDGQRGASGARDGGGGAAGCAAGEPPRYRWHLGCVLPKSASNIVADRG